MDAAHGMKRKTAATWDSSLMTAVNRIVA